jgi:hypothetical protein
LTLALSEFLMFCYFLGQKPRRVPSLKYILLLDLDWRDRSGTERRTLTCKSTEIELYERVKSKGRYKKCFLDLLSSRWVYCSDFSSSFVSVCVVKWIVNAWWWWWYAYTVL